MISLLKDFQPLIKSLFLGGAIFMASNMCVLAQTQEVIEIQPLFEYPVAPEDLPTMFEKSNYLVEHFWDKMDLKGKNAVDQNALNHAFKVYAVSMRFADRAKTLQANQRLVNTLSKNPILLMQFTKAAEENIYGSRAEFWIDEVYSQFLKAFVANKKLPDNKKLKYSKQLATITNTSEGMVAPKFEFENKEGIKETYFPMSTPTLIIFGNPWDIDWRMARLNIESDLSIYNAIEKGQINIIYILPQFKEGWQKEVSNYSPKWKVGLSDNIDNIYDLRVSPAIYVIGKDGKILVKNISLGKALSEIMNLIKE